MTVFVNPQSAPCGEKWTGGTRAVAPQQNTFQFRSSNKYSVSELWRVNNSGSTEYLILSLSPPSQEALPKVNPLIEFRSRTKLWNTTSREEWARVKQETRTQVGIDFGFLCCHVMRRYFDTNITLQCGGDDKMLSHDFRDTPKVFRTQRDGGVYLFHPWLNSSSIPTWPCFSAQLSRRPYLKTWYRREAEGTHPLSDADMSQAPASHYRK